MTTMKRHLIYLSLLLAGALTGTACHDNEPEMAPQPDLTPETPADPTPDIDIQGCDLWEEYEAAQKNGGESTLLDFSYAGYDFGERGVPSVDSYVVFNVQQYGAIPNDGLSDRLAVQAAIDAAAASGQKAVVYFPKGRYDLRPQDSPNTKITVDADNIVLKGDGCGEGGTEIYMEYPNDVLDASLWNTPELITFTRSVKQSDEQLLLATVAADSPRGSHTVTVASTSGLHMGQRILLRLYNNDPELVADEVKPYDVHTEWSELPQQGVQVTEYHQIQRIEGNTVTFKEPVMHKIEARWGWTLHEHQHHVGCGVEDIAFRGNWQDSFIHHKDAVTDSGFRLLTLHRQINGWVRRCRFIDVSEAVSVMLSANVSVYDCTIEGHQGHSAIRSQASSHVFLGKLTDEPAQYHSIGVSKTAIGNVLWRNKTAANSCFESHSSQPRATLIDACEGGFLPNHAGGDAAAGPNHLADLTLWNYRETGSAGGTFDLWVRNNRFLMPILAGYQGSTLFLPEQVTADESHGTAVEPASLYEAQLLLRLGSLPQWLQELKGE